MEVLRNNKLAENLLHLALAQGASDMHIEPDGQGVRVRIRVDGLLQQLCVLPRTQQSTLLTQLKVWSGMDIAEKRVPQDGRLLLEHEGSEVDLRLASLPTVNGEKLAIRFLQRQDNLLRWSTCSSAKVICSVTVSFFISKRLGAFDRTYWQR